MEDKKTQTKVTEPVSGIVIDGQKWTFVGIPPSAFIHPPSPFGDQTKVPLYFVERAEHPPQGGFLTYRRAHKYPFKGIVTPDLLGAVNIAKRRLRDDIKWYVEHWYYWIGNLLIPFWRKKYLWDLADLYATYTYLFLRQWYIRPESNPSTCGECLIRNLSDEDRNKMDAWLAENPQGDASEFLASLPSFPQSRQIPCPGWYSPAPKEFLRVCRKIFTRGTLSEKKNWIIDKFVIDVAMFLESDDSYRYLTQDMFGILNKAEFIKSPSKELARVFSIFLERGRNREQGTHNDMENRFKTMVLGLRVLFFLFPSWKRKAREFMQEIDIEKMKMDAGDWYYSLTRPDYKYGGLSFEERIAERKRIDGVHFESIPKQYEETTTSLGVTQ